MLSAKLDEPYRFPFGQCAAEILFTGNSLVIKSNCRPGPMSILRPECTALEFRIMQDCLDGTWRSIGIADQMEPGSRVVIEIGDQRLAIEVIGMTGKEVCFWIGTEELEPRSA